MHQILPYNPVNSPLLFYAETPLTGHSFGNLERKQLEANFLWDCLFDFYKITHCGGSEISIKCLFIQQSAPPGLPPLIDPFPLLQLEICTPYFKITLYSDISTQMHKHTQIPSSFSTSGLSLTSCIYVIPTQ